MTDEQLVANYLHSGSREASAQLIDHNLDPVRRVVHSITEKARDLVAKELSREDRIADLKKRLADGKRPALTRLHRIQ